MIKRYWRELFILLWIKCIVHYTPFFFFYRLLLVASFIICRFEPWNIWSQNLLRWRRTSGKFAKSFEKKEEQIPPARDGRPLWRVSHLFHPLSLPFAEILLTSCFDMFLPSDKNWVVQDIHPNPFKHPRGLIGFCLSCRRESWKLSQHQSPIFASRLG